MNVVWMRLRQWMVNCRCLPSLSLRGWVVIVIGLALSAGVASLLMMGLSGRSNVAAQGNAAQFPAAHLGPPDHSAHFLFSIDKPGSGLLRPMAVAEGATGEIYVADSGHAVIQVFDHAGVFLRAIGRPAAGRPPGAGELIYPVGLAMDPSGQLYVADVQAGRIAVFSPEGDFVGTFGDGSLSGPIGLVYHDNTWIVNDIGAQQVLVLDARGEVIARRGADKATGQLAYANYSALSPGGQLAVADSNNNRVLVFSSSGVLSTTLSTVGDEPLLMPRGVGYDSLGRLHVVSAFRHQVVVFDRSLAFAFAYGQNGSGEGQFNFPNGLWISGERIYVADRENNRVQVWQLATAP